MSDIVERLRVHGDQFPIKNSAEWVDFASLYLVEAADEIERLRAALRGVMQETERHHAENITRAELGGSDMAQRKAKAIVSRSGVLLHSIKGIARAALEERT